MIVRFVTCFLRRSLKGSCFVSINFRHSIDRFSRFSNFSRSYSQQIKEIEKNKLPIVKKTRIRRKLEPKESVQKSGFWNVVAVSTAEEYHLESLLKTLLVHKNYHPSNTFDSIYSTDLNFDFIHATAYHKMDNENRELFFFRQGSFVAWNISDAEVENVVHLMKNFEIEPYDEKIIKNEIEVMPYTYAINNNKSSVLHNGNICLTQELTKSPLDRYTCSNGMICSVKLGVWESLLDEFIESIEPITLDLKKGNLIRLSRKELLKKTGELYSLKHKINLSSDLLDIPDFYWEREELETLYINTCRYFNVPKRTRVINDKIHHCIELVDLLSSHLSDKHHIRLEWMIIILIMVEVGFEFLHYFNNH